MRFLHVVSLGVASLTLVLGVGLQQPVSAQPKGGKARPVCMAIDRGSDHSFVILVPRANVEAMKAKGFERMRCVRKTTSRKSRRAWRNSICALAAEPDEALQKRFAEQYGERPSVLCGMAEQVMGRAKGRKTK